MRACRPSRHSFVITVAQARLLADRPTHTLSLGLYSVQPVAPSPRSSTPKPHHHHSMELEVVEEEEEEVLVYGMPYRPKEQRARPLAAPRKKKSNTTDPIATRKSKACNVG